jgi:peptidoglycan/LPS O-acetylase OafA/YrhL
MSSKTRSYTLDGIRGIGAIMVVWQHIPHSDSMVFRACLSNLFFVLSGVLIAENYGPRLRENLACGNFMQARFVRLYMLLG